MRIGKGNKYSRKTHPTAALSTTNPASPNPRRNLPTSQLSYGMAPLAFTFEYVPYHSVSAFIIPFIPCLNYNTLSFSYMAGQVRIRYPTYIYNVLLRIAHTENRIACSYLFIELLCSFKNFKYLLMFFLLVL
jgi:hypothetical protein